MAQNANAQIFSEDFQGLNGAFPVGWTLINNDGLTPNANTAYVTDAWVVRDDFIAPQVAGDTCAFSNSWYTPAGTADDWMITPQIMNLPANAQVSWDANAPDAGYPDGYEVLVSTTTPTIGAFTAIYSNPAENSNWTPRTADLSAYAGQNIYIAWRNNSTDMFLLMVDNISVDVILPFDVALSDTTNEEYTITPLDHTGTIELDAIITNTGGNDVTNAMITANVYDGTMSLVYNASSTPVPTLASGAAVTATVPGFTPATSDFYTFEIIAGITEADGDQNNDTLMFTHLVSDSIYARDNGVVAGSLGIGAGNGGQLGQQFELLQNDDMTSVSFFLSNAAGNLNGEDIYVSVYDMAAGVPNAVVAETDTITILDAVDSLYTLPIYGGPASLATGMYTVVVNEPDSTLALAYSNDIFTPQTTWLDWPTNPNGGWTNNEFFAFNVSYILRPNFACIPTSSMVTAAACETYTWAQNGITYMNSGMYMDTVMNAAGCDSVVTLDLTINVPDATTETVSECTAYTWAADGNTYNMSGMYTATLTNAAGCDSVVTLDLTIGGVDNTTSTAGTTISANQTGATYQWIDCGNGNMAIAGETNQSYTPTLTGDYAVIVTSGACSDTSACVTIDFSALDELVIGDVEIFPNPSDGQLTVSLTNLVASDIRLELTDAAGRVILSSDHTNVGESMVIPVVIENAQDGLYFIKVSSDEGELTERIIISK